MWLLCFLTYWRLFSMGYTHFKEKFILRLTVHGWECFYFTFVRTGVLKFHLPHTCKIFEVSLVQLTVLIIFTLNLLQRGSKLIGNPTRLCTITHQPQTKQDLTHPEQRSWSGEPKRKQMLLILSNKFEMLKRSLSLSFLQTESSVNMQNMLKRKNNPWAWTKTNVKTSHRLPMGFGPETSTADFHFTHERE